MENSFSIPANWAWMTPRGNKSELARARGKASSRRRNASRRSGSNRRAKSSGPNVPALIPLAMNLADIVPASTAIGRSEAATRARSPGNTWTFGNTEETAASVPLSRAPSVAVNRFSDAGKKKARTPPGRSARRASRKNSRVKKRFEAPPSPVGNEHKITS